MTSVTIPNSVTTISARAFSGCSGLPSVTIPNSVTTIDVGVFYGCSGLTSITIPNSVTSIGASAFNDCYGLTSVTIPNSVTSIGGSAFYGCTSLTSITIPNSVTYIYQSTFNGCSGLTSVIIPNGVTTIGLSAFSGCSSLTSVTIPNSVTSIEYNAFENCSGLTSVIIPNSVRSIGFKAFSNCSSLTSVIIPNSVTVISRNSFEGCSGLTSINIPNSVTIIGDYAFYSCSVLTSVTVEAKTPITISDNVFSNRANATLYVPAGSKAAYEAADYWKEFGTILESIEGSTFTAQTTEGWDMVFTILDEDAKTCQVGYLDGSQDKVAVDKGRVEGSLTIPESVNDYTVVKIGKHAFNNVYRMTSVTIPNTVTSIDEYAFRDCRGLTSITIPNSVTSIGNHAFSYCSGLTSITIPNSVTSIGQYAFHACNGLTSVTIPQNVTSIGHGVFASCPNLTSLSVEAGNTKYDSRNNCNAIIETETNTLIFGTNNTIIPNSVTAIGKLAFNGCSNITSITIPNSVTTIEDGAFSWCSGLTSIIIPSSVTFIGQDAFMGCYGLTSLSVEAANTKYDSRNNCNAIIETETNKLVSGTINTVIPNSVTVIGNNAFYNLWGLTSITIPNSVTSIEDDAFNLCGGMTSITIPNSVTSIGNGAFQNCSRLTSVTVEAKTPITISDNVFTNRANATLYVPEGSKAAYEAADYWKDFKDIKSEPDPVHIRTEVIDGIYYNLYSDYTAEVTKTPDDSPKYSGAITIPTSVMYNTAAYSVTSIGDEAFDNCRSLTSVTIPNSVTSIGNSAFADCNGLTSITIPNSVTSIGIYAFLDCTSLTSITIPNRVTTLSRAAFTNCISLTSVTIPNSVLSIGGDVFRDCSGLTSIIIPNSVTTIGSRAFAGCSGLTSLSVEDGNTKYDSRNNCNAIIETETNRLVFGTNITIIPNSVTAIGSEAFFDCRGLTSITIPNSVTTIENDAFYQCFSLTSVTVEAKTPITISDNTFSTRTNATLYVPAGSKSAYEAVYYWRDFKEIIEMNDNPVSEYTDEQGVKYTLNADGKTYSVSGYTDACTGDVTIPSSVNGCSVTSIGDYAFDNCFGLASITIPNSVTSIGFGAFIDCSGLTSITIPNSVFVIADRAFYYCTSLTSVTIPNSVTSIGNSVFSACTALSSMVVDSGNPSYDSRNNCNALIETSSNTLIAGCMNTTIPNSVTSIGGDALYKCSGLTHITIPNSVTSIGDHAFYGCSGLTSITIPNSVTRIGFDAFSDCSGLISVAVESGNTVYDSRNDCDAIIETASNTLIKGCKNTIIPNNVTNIGNNAFASCSDLTSIVIPNSVTTIGGDAFASCSSLASIIIPNSVTNIGEQAFRKCHGLTSITVESGNTIYDSRDDCNAIVETASNTLKAGCMNTTIPNSVTNIGNCAFWGCSNLTSISIPNSVTSIGSEAFEDCLNLNDVYCYADNVPNTSSYAFYNSNIYNATLHVPNGSIDTYKAMEPWKNFKNIVEMAPDPTITITAKSYSRAYGEENPAFDFDVTGGTITGTPEITCEATTTSDVGTYDIIISKGTITNNDVTYVNGTLTITTKTVESPTITLSQTSYIFDGSEKKPTVTVADGGTTISSDEYTVSYSNNTNVGTATVTITDKDGGNYNVSGSATFAITAADGSLTPPTGKSGLVYTGAAQDLITAGSCTTGTLQYSQDGTNYGTTIPQGTDAKEYTVYYQVKGDANHKDIAAKSFIVTIAKAPLKITAKSYTRKQGEANPEFGVTYEGFKNNETDAVLTTKPTVTCAATKDSPAGTYDITVSGAVAGNYEISYVAGILTVEAVTPPAPEPEPEGTTFDVDTDDSSTKEVKVTFVVNEDDGSGTPSVSISDDKDASGSVSISETVTHNGVEYKVTEIGEGAFQNNTGLTEVSIPASVTSIGENAFAGCTNLKSITVYNETPINLSVVSARGFTRTDGSSVFEGVDKETCILYVPEGSVDAYKAAPGWKEFKNILAIGTTGIYGIVVSNGEAFDVFSISGQKVKAKATSLDGLPKGIYIINGKKVIKK